MASTCAKLAEQVREGLDAHFEALDASSTSKYADMGLPLIGAPVGEQVNARFARKADNIVAPNQRGRVDRPDVYALDRGPNVGVVEYRRNQCRVVSAVADHNLPLPYSWNLLPIEKVKPPLIVRSIWLIAALLFQKPR